MRICCPGTKPGYAVGPERSFGSDPIFDTRWHGRRVVPARGDADPDREHHGQQGHDQQHLPREPDGPADLQCLRLHRSRPLRWRSFRLNRTVGRGERSEQGSGTSTAGTFPLGGASAKRVEIDDGDGSLIGSHPAMRAKGLHRLGDRLARCAAPLGKLSLRHGDLDLDAVRRQPIRQIHQPTGQSGSARRRRRAQRGAARPGGGRGRDFSPPPRSPPRACRATTGTRRRPGTPPRRRSSW